MKRLALAVAAVAVLSAPAAAANCAKDYKEFWEKQILPSKKLSGDDIARINRVALRGYDACSAGDERFNVENFWKKLETVNPAKVEDIFKDLEKNLPAKKK